MKFVDDDDDDDDDRITCSLKFVEIPEYKQIFKIR